MKGTRIVVRPVAAVAWAVLAWAPAVAAAEAPSVPPMPAIIPEPVSLTVEAGAFEVKPSTQVTAAGAARSEADKLIEMLAPAMAFRLELAEAARGADAIALELDAGLMGKLGGEGYTLQVMPRRIDIRAAGPAGLFYAIQTLRQLLPAEAFGAAKAPNARWSVPCVRITDYPRFGWRGLLIDPARHFIPPEDVLRFIDAAAIHKFNRLQIHLTDDQGWRLEVRKHPELTEIGSRMDFSRRRGKDGQYLGGFYTQEQVRRIVAHAAARHITIVPEIEMPAHTGAAIVACPRLGLDPGQIAALPPEQRWAKVRGLLAPRPETVAFMQEVLAEVMDLLPGLYIHIGGDEANTALWVKDEEMQALMRRLGLKDVHELHSWFIRQLDTFVTKHGRRMVGWDEILQGGLAPGAMVMSWRGTQGGITAARAGHDVVMTPTSHTYFDYYQGPPEKEPKAIGGLLPWEKVYSFEPVSADLTGGQARHILGGQGQLWGEFIPDRAHREYMAFPRACALSEALWSPKSARDGDRFLPRLRAHLQRLKAAGINYRAVDGAPVR